METGGVIRFWPVLGMGLGITFIAGIIYVLAWEAALAVTGAEIERFRVQYSDRMFRMPMTFVEIFPVGVLVSLVSAGWLRTRRARG